MSETKKYQNESWLKEQYLIKQRKIVDIAIECNVNRKTINFWLRKFKFPKRKFSGVHNNHLIGKENPNWKGDDVSYKCLHDWVRKHKPKPEKCERCGKEQDYLEASNISGEYKRDINDYEYLCVKCHKEKDGVLQKWIDAGKATRFKEGHKNELRYGGIN